MQLGPYTLATNLFLSPLAGYTNLPMRLTVRALGGLGWATTDLVNARALLERRHRALELVTTAPGDEPLAVQLFGCVQEEMRDAAQFVESLGVAAVDINMGCPVPKVCRIGGGASLMTELPKTRRLVRAVVRAVRIPVTVKMRLGWDERNITAPELAAALEDEGVAAVFVHGRTRAQGFSGRVSLGGIRAVVGSVRGIPVVGNGDVTTPEAASHMLRETGCAGVSIGRGAFYNPWIFRQTAALLSGGDPGPDPSFSDRVRVMRTHFQRYIEFYGEERGCVLFRRVAPWYARRFGPARAFRAQVASIRSVQDFESVLASYIAWRSQFCDERGELLPAYLPRAQETVFAEDSTEGEEAPAIPVPKGPVELW